MLKARMAGESQLAQSSGCVRSQYGPREAMTHAMLLSRSSEGHRTKERCCSSMEGFCGQKRTVQKPFSESTVERSTATTDPFGDSVARPNVLRTTMCGRGRHASSKPNRGVSERPRHSGRSRRSRILLLPPGVHRALLPFEYTVRCEGSC